MSESEVFLAKAIDEHVHRSLLKMDPDERIEERAQDIYERFDVVPDRLRKEVLSRVWFMARCYLECAREEGADLNKPVAVTRRFGTGDSPQPDEPGLVISIFETPDENPEDELEHLKGWQAGYQFATQSTKPMSVEDNEKILVSELTNQSPAWQSGWDEATAFHKSRMTKPRTEK